MLTSTCSSFIMVPKVPIPITFPFTDGISTARCAGQRISQMISHFLVMAIPGVDHDEREGKQTRLCPICEPKIVPFPLL